MRYRFGDNFGAFVVIWICDFPVYVYETRGGEVGVEEYVGSNG